MLRVRMGKYWIGFVIAQEEWAAHVPRLMHMEARTGPQIVLGAFEWGSW